MAPRRRTLALSWTAVGGGRRHDEADVATVVRFAKRTKVVPTAWCTRSIHPFVNAFMGKDVSKSTWRRDPTSRRPAWTRRPCAARKASVLYTAFMAVHFALLTLICTRCALAATPPATSSLEHTREHTLPKNQCALAGTVSDRRLWKRHGLAWS